MRSHPNFTYADTPDSLSSRRKAWFAISALILLIGLLLLARAGRLLIFLFPLSSFAIGIYLFQNVPTIYIGFTWWLMFLSPFIKRIIDYQSGYLTLGMFNFTALLVGMISLVTFIRYLPKANEQNTIPFAICIGSIFYSVLIGIIQRNPWNAMVNSTFAWMCPLLLGFHIFVNWKDYPKYRRSIQSTFFWGVLVMGIYGIFQFLVAPEWDRFWLISLNYFSQGRPEPLGIRVWSTMTSAHDFGNVMMAGLILLFCNTAPNLLRLPATGMGYLAFLLTIARTVWLSWFIGLLTFLMIQRGKFQVRLIISIVALSILVIPLTFIEPFSSVISSRLETFSNLSSDVSYNARIGGYTDLLFSSFSNIFGQGLGSALNVEDTTIAAWDSSILPTLMQMGLIGSIPYFITTLVMILTLFQKQVNSLGSFESAICAIVVGVFSQLGLNFIFVGSTGMILWSFIGLGLASSKYYFNQSLIQYKVH